MGFHEDAVDACSNAGLGDKADEFGLTASYTTALVRLLKRMSHIQDDGYVKLLHGSDIAIIHHQILVAEHGATLCQHYLVIARLPDFLDRKAHGLARKELPLFNVDGLARFGSCNKEVSLTTEESRDLQYIHIFGGHGSFFG